MKGNGRGTYIALETSSIQGIWDHPTRREVQGDGAAGHSGHPQTTSRKAIDCTFRIF